MIKNKIVLLPYIKKIKSYTNINTILPISIKKKKDIKITKKIINKYFSESQYYFNKKIKTIYNNQFIFKEIIREKTIRFIGDEIPYFIKFNIKKISKKYNNLHIMCNIYTKKKQYIPILKGKSGKKIKKIIDLSQKSIKKYLKFKNKIFLYIKIKKYKN